MTAARLERAVLLAAIRAAAANGVDWVQVRDPHATARELFELVEDVIAICRERRVRVAVNDRVDVALAAGADGVQLGERSLPVTAARRIAPDLRFGVSVHDVASAQRAEAEGADWVTFGHVFATSSHPGEPPPGLDELARVTGAVQLPVIAIGGIGPDQVEAVLAAKAAGIAVISAIVHAPDPGAATAALRRRLGQSA